MEADQDIFSSCAESSTTWAAQSRNAGLFNARTPGGDEHRVQVLGKAHLVETLTQGSGIGKAHLGKLCSAFSVRALCNYHALVV